MKHILGFAMLLGAMTPAITAAQDIGMGIEVGKKAPAAAVQTLDGKAADLSSYIGKQPVLMEFWAVWCPNCKELEPSIKAMHAKYGKQVTFLGVGVSVNQSPALVKKYVENHKLDWGQVFDNSGDATDKYDVPATSFVVLVDKTGKIAYTGLGGDQKLEQALKKVLP